LKGRLNHAASAANALLRSRGRPCRWVGRRSGAMPSFRGPAPVAFGVIAAGQSLTMPPRSVTGPGGVETNLPEEGAVIIHGCRRKGTESDAIRASCTSSLPLPNDRDALVLQEGHGPENSTEGNGCVALKDWASWAARSELGLELGRLLGASQTTRNGLEGNPLLLLAHHSRFPVLDVKRVCRNGFWAPTAQPCPFRAQDGA